MLAFSMAAPSARRNIHSEASPRPIGTKIAPPIDLHLEIAYLVSIIGNAHTGVHGAVKRKRQAEPVPDNWCGHLFPPFLETLFMET